MEKRNTMDTSTQASALRWEAIIDKMEDCICLLDADFNIININKAMREFLGRPEEDIIGKKCWTLIHGTAGPPDFCPMTKMVESKKRESVTIQLKGRYLRVTVDPILDEDGSIKGAVHIIRDIDESERNNLSIRESEKKYHELVNTMSDVVFTLDFDGGVIDASPTMERIIDWSVKESIGKRFSDFVHPNDLPAAEGEFIRAIQGKGRPIEIRIVAADGALRWVKINALLIMRDGEPDNLLCVLTDIHEKKLAEEALAKNQTLLSDTVRMAKIGGWEFDVKTMTQKWTEETFRILEIDVTGGEPKVPEGIQFIAPEYRPMAEKAIQRAIEHGEPYDQEWEVVTTKGNRRWVRSIAKANLENGKIMSVSGSFQDITDFKQAADMLHESEKKYRLLVDSATEAILVGQDGIIRLANPSAVTMTGYSEQELMSKPFQLFVHPDDRAMLMEHHQRRLRGETVPARYVFRAIVKDGSTKWMEMSGVSIEWEGRPATLNFMTDITERKQAEERLRESEEDLKEANTVLREERNKAQHYLNDARAIIVNLDRSGNISLINKRGCEMLGMSEPDIIGKNWFDNFIPEDVRTNIKRVFDGLMAGRIDNFENYDNPLLASDRTVRMISWHNALLKDESGGIIGTLSVGEDISERLQMEMNLKMVTENLSKINTSLIDAKLRSQTYFDFLAHDIANILSPIMAYAELMSKGEQYPPEIRSYTVKIVDQAQKATSLIHNLRKLEMLEEKNLPDMNIVDIKRIFSFVENSITHKYPEKKPTFVYHLPEDIPIKSRGGEYIDFVIRHVFDNAVRHAQRDTVNIDVRINKEGENAGGKFWRILIEDDGPGISDRIKKEITTPLDPAKRYSRGVASSLAFCSAAVVGIGGELQIEDRVPNDPSKGTRVTVWIPVYD